MRDATSLVELGRQLIDEARGLVRKEIELAKVETIGLLKTNAIALGVVVGAAILLLVLLIMIQVALIVTFLAAALWIAWGLVVFWVLVIAVLAIVGRSRFKFKPPEKTISTIKGDIEWAREQIRSNGRS